MLDAAARSEPQRVQDEPLPHLRYSDPANALPPVAAPAFFMATWSVAIVLALLGDRTVSYLLQAYDLPHLLADHATWLLRIVRAPGVFLTYLPILAVLCFVPRWRWRGSLLLASACAYAGLAVTLLKWAVGRYRPFCDGLPNPHPFDLRFFAGGLHGLFSPPSNLCFPSGHTALAFAAATSLGMIFPQRRWSFWTIAALTGLSRIVQGAHYTSDVLAGVVVGVTAAILARYAVASLCNRLRHRSAHNPAATPA